MSKYDTIRTAADLVAEVVIHGLSTAQEDINRAADIFGRSTIEELVALANDIGRNNEKGEPDPKGTWCSNRRGTRDTFYFIVFTVLGWEQATDFHNTYTLEIPKIRQERDKALEKSAQQQEELNALYRRHANLVDDNEKLVETNKQLTEEVIRLKAKLYDLMTGAA
jgi:hypothetical protein